MMYLPFVSSFFTFHEPLCHFAAEYVRSEHIAEEVVQEVFAEVWKKRENLDPNQSVKAYLYQSVKNRALDFQRRHQTEQKYLKRATKGSQVKTEEPKISLEGKSEFKIAAQRAIENLPKRGRQIYKLSRKEGLTYREIATVLDISPKTVESQMSRSLKKLRQELRPLLSIMLSVICELL